MKKNCLILPLATVKEDHYKNLSLGMFPYYLVTTGNKTILENAIDVAIDTGYDKIYVYVNNDDFIKNSKIIKSLINHNMYYNVIVLSDFRDLGNDIYKTDIVNLFPLYENLSEQEYKEFLIENKEKNPSRYFNEISKRNGLIIKKALTPQAIKLQEVEANFYEAYSWKVKSMCKVYKYDSKSHELTLEPINGGTVQEFVEKYPNKTNELILDVIDDLKEFNKVEVDVKDSKEDIDKALYNELIEKIDSRVKPVLPMIKKFMYNDYFDNPLGIDFMKFVGHNIIMGGIKKWFKDNKDKFHFGVCHGDPNTDNTLIDNEGYIKFIDPRGYFGDLRTIGYGLCEYDIAKFCYGINGYSVFNSAPYIEIDVDDYDGNITVKYPHHKGSITQFDLDDMPIDDNIRIIIGIIWMKLSSYIINDPMKSVIAYLYGNAICTKYLIRNGYMK